MSTLFSYIGKMIGYNKSYESEINNDSYDSIAKSKDQSKDCSGQSTIDTASSEKEVRFDTIKETIPNKKSIVKITYPSDDYPSIDHLHNDMFIDLNDYKFRRPANLLIHRKSSSMN